MIGIYKYQNKINDKIYIGQSVNIERRYLQHIQDAKNRPEKGTGIDIAINKYGINNFTFEIIEECPVEQLNEREKFWIEYFDSYNNGYNRTIGGDSLKGEEHPRAILTEEQVWQIRDCYGKRIKRSEVFKMFQDTGISERGFLKIWNCENWTNIHTDVYTKENKEWHKKQIGHSEDQIGLSSLDRAITQEEIDIWLKDYQNDLTINAISKKYHRDNGTVAKYISNPNAIQKINYQGRKVKNLNTNKIFNSISAAAKWAKCGATTLTRHLATDKIAGFVPETNEPAIWEDLS